MEYYTPEEKIFIVKQYYGRNSEVIPKNQFLARILFVTRALTVEVPSISSRPRKALQTPNKPFIKTTCILYMVDSIVNIATRSLTKTNFPQITSIIRKNRSSGRNLIKILYVQA